MLALMVGAVTVAFLHSFAPDHWVPLVAIARSSSWSMRRLAVIAALAGIAHVVVSTGLALAAVWLGMHIEALSGINAFRGDAAVWVLIVFGLLYTLWGLVMARRNSQHEYQPLSKEAAIQQYATRRVIILLLIMVIGPAEPIVPMLFVAHSIGAIAIWAVGILFTLTLSSMIVIQCCLAYAGIRSIRYDWFERHIHTLSGLAVLATGLLLLFA